MQDNDLPHDPIGAVEDARLTDDLQRLHQRFAARNAASLARVQARLREQEQRARVSRRAARLPLTFPTTSHPPFIKEQHMSSDNASSNAGSALWRRLSVLVASLLLVALVGGMATVFALAHQSHSTGQKHHMPVAATSTTLLPPYPAPARGLYLLIQKDWTSNQISKLDPQTRQPLWTRDAGSIEGPLVVYGDTLFAIDSTGSYPNETNGIAAFSAEDGTLLWHTYFSQDSFRAPDGSGPYDLGMLAQPTVAGGIVYILARDGKLYALDAATGKQRWSYTAPATVLIDDPVTLADGTMVHNYGLEQVQPVTFDNGVVYGAIHNALFAVDARTGKQLWSSKIDQVLFFNSPVSADGALYLSSSEESHGHSGQSQKGFISAYNPKHGALIWRHSVGNWVLTPPTVTNGIVYFGSYDDHLYALKAGDGSQLWSYNTGGHIFDQPFVSGTSVYIDELGNGGEDTGPSTVAPALFAINAASGTLLWLKAMSKEGGSLQAVQNGQVYLGVFPGTLTILSTQDGSQLWSQRYTKLTDKYGNDVGSPPLITLVP